MPFLPPNQQRLSTEDINVSQASAATYTRCGGIFTNVVTANLLENLSPEIFQTSAKIRQRVDNGRDFGVFSPIMYRPTFDVNGYVLLGHKSHSFLNGLITGTWIFHFFQ